MDFRGDLDLPVTVAAMSSAIGKMFDQVFLIFKIFAFFVFFINSKTKQNKFFMYTDIGPIWPVRDPWDVALPA